MKFGNTRSRNGCDGPQRRVLDALAFEKLTSLGRTPVRVESSIRSGGSFFSFGEAVWLRWAEHIG